MTETEFRVNHSNLMQYYQLIEMRLKGICAELKADDNRDWYERLDDYENDPLGKLLNRLENIQKEKSNFVVEETILTRLDNIRTARNYWCHQCFGGDRPIVFKRINKKMVVKNDEDATRILIDLEEATEMDARLTECFLKCRNKENAVI